MIDLSQRSKDVVAARAATAGSTLMPLIVQGTWRHVYPVTLTQISVGSATEIWGVNSKKEVLKFAGEWIKVLLPQAAGLTQVSAASDGEVWCVSDGKIYRHNGISWDQIKGPKTPSATLAQVSVGSATQIWGVDSNHHVFHFNGTTGVWDDVSSGIQLSNVSVASDGTVWGVSDVSPGHIYRRDGNSWTSIPEPTTPFVKPLTQISVGSATQVWGLTSDGKIAQYTGNDQNPWVQFHGTLSNVSVASDGTLWGVQSSGDIFYLVPINTSSLSISEPKLVEANLAQADKAFYQFQVTNIGPGTIISDLILTLDYDEELFNANGVTVGAVPGVPGPLDYGQSASPQFTLTTRPSAVTGTYGFYSVRAVFTVTRQNLPISSNSGGWMTFTVTAD